MDKIREDKWKHYRRVEDIIRNIEETEEKTKETIRLQAGSNSRSIGPANDLLRFFYIMEQQYQSDSDEIRTEARESVLEYIDQFRQSPVVSDEEEEEEEKDDDGPTDGPQSSASIVRPDPQPSTTVTQPPTVASFPPLLSTGAVSLPQPPIVVPFPPPLSTDAVSLPQPPIVVPFPPPLSTDAVFLPQPLTAVPSRSSSKFHQALLDLKNERDYILPNSFETYEKILLEAEEYEKRYETIDDSRKKQLTSRIKETMNKIREETSTILTKELFDFLNGQEQKVGHQNIRILNEEERLYCLSRLALLILDQLLGGDLTAIKSDIFLPLVGAVSEHQKHPEFRIIFLDRLHKKCPYTVPFYPKRQPSMDDKQYLEAIGYMRKREGDQMRLETEDEFIPRMTGFIRCFCKLLIRRGPPFDTNLSFAWTWFSNILNLPPRPNLTAVLIYVFLEEAGISMLQQYSNQFRKIIQTIEQEYLPKFKKDTKECEISRLRSTLNKITSEF